MSPKVRVGLLSSISGYGSRHTWPLLPDNLPLPLARFGFHRYLGGILFFPVGDNAHLTPVVCEFSATVQTNYISSCGPGRGQTPLTAFAAHGEAEALVPTAEQHVQNFQFSSPLFPWLAAVINPDFSRGFSTGNSASKNRLVCALRNWTKSASTNCPLLYRTRNPGQIRRGLRKKCGRVLAAVKKTSRLASPSREEKGRYQK